MLCVCIILMYVYELCSYDDCVCLAIVSVSVFFFLLINYI